MGREGAWKWSGVCFLANSMIIHLFKSTFSRIDKILVVVDGGLVTPILCISCF